MTRLFDDNGAAHGVTVLSVGDCSVVGNRTSAKNGYNAVVLGMNEAKEKHMAKPQIVAAKKDGVKLFRKICEFRVSEDCLIPVGTSLSAGHFVTGGFVDIQGTSKGKGFQGAMKRHNFGGKEASHGVLKAHRSLGSIGNREWPGKVFKGRKMAGQMGGETVSVQNLKIFGINEDDNLIYVSGAVPGANGSFVMITDSIKKEHEGLPVPTRFAADAVAEPESGAVAENAEPAPEEQTEVVAPDERAEAASEEKAGE
jgi:large subunit ribosomal protein L3